MAVSSIRRCVGHSLIGAALAALFLTATIPAASAQQVVVIVNGDPITALDIEQRSKLVEASNHKAPSRQEVIDELINERLQIKEGKKFGLEASDTEVDNAYAGMANRMRISTEQFGEVLGKSGIKPPTLKAKLRAQIVWTQLVKGRFQSIASDRRKRDPQRGRRQGGSKGFDRLRILSASDPVHCLQGFGRDVLRGTQTRGRGLTRPFREL